MRDDEDAIALPCPRCGDPVTFRRVADGSWEGTHEEFVQLWRSSGARDAANRARSCGVLRARWVNAPNASGAIIEGVAGIRRG